LVRAVHARQIAPELIECGGDALFDVLAASESLLDCLPDDCS